MKWSLNTSGFEMCETQHFETQLKTFFLNFETMFEYIEILKKKSRIGVGLVSSFKTWTQQVLKKLETTQHWFYLAHRSFASTSHINQST